MTIDEAIAKYRKLAKLNKVEYEVNCDCYGKETVDRAEKLDCLKRAEEYEQIAEWLEELKELRVIFGKIIREIDELQNYACFPTEWVSCEQSEVHTYYAKELTKILKLAKQLKVGGNNDKSI